jgi:hypothetical protein
VTCFLLQGRRCQTSTKRLLWPGEPIARLQLFESFYLQMDSHFVARMQPVNGTPSRPMP